MIDLTHRRNTLRHATTVTVPTMYCLIAVITYPRSPCCSCSPLALSELTRSAGAYSGNT